MGYCDDLTILNVSFSTMYGTSHLQQIHTVCHYLGVMQGEVFCGKVLEKRPFVYFTPRNIVTANGWQSPVGSSRTNAYIECTGERADRLFRAFGAGESTKIYVVEEAAPYIACLREIARLLKIGTPEAEIRQTLCFEEFAALLESQLHTRRNSAGCRYGIEEVVRRINAEPGARYCWKSEAAAAGITLRHWNRLFAGFTGGPPGEYLADCRLKLARQLLSNSELPVKVIAMQCGFEQPSDFIRFFKRHTSQTPGDFRRCRLL